MTTESAPKGPKNTAQGNALGTRYVPRHHVPRHHALKGQKKPAPRNGPWPFQGWNSLCGPWVLAHARLAPLVDYLLDGERNLGNLGTLGKASSSWSHQF